MAEQGGIDPAVLASIEMPDTVWSPLGDLSFFDGVPTAESIATSFDLIDLLRGVEAYLDAMPGVSLVAMRRGFREVGVDSPRKIAFTEPRANSGSLYLTPNTETTYGSAFLDLKADGPTVIEAPPQSLCVVDDFWFRYVADMGIPGPDQGAGGKYLFLPPDHEGEVPDGYFTFTSPTYTNWVVLRALEGVEGIKKTRIYPLADAADPPANEFVNIAAVPHNTIHSNDFSFYEEVDELIQEEPVEALDPERAGLLAAIGIAKGQKFEPDERLRGLLAKAAPIAAAIARANVYRPRDPAAYLNEGSSWKNAFVGGSYEFLRNGARLLDARSQFHYFATVITPAMAAAQVGAGSAYAYTAEDSTGAWLDGGKDYRLHLPGPIPAKNFWSVDVYDTQTRSLLMTDDPYPSVMSLSPEVESDADGGADVYFGPTAPAGKEANWIGTVPGKSWFPMIRLYGPLEPWFDKTWRLGEIEPG